MVWSLWNDMLIFWSKDFAISDVFAHSPPISPHHTLMERRCTTNETGKLLCTLSILWMKSVHFWCGMKMVIWSERCLFFLCKASSIVFRVVSPFGYSSQKDLDSMFVKKLSTLTKSVKIWTHSPLRNLHLVLWTSEGAEVLSECSQIYNTVLDICNSLTS